jgi:hypothetical protein
MSDKGEVAGKIAAVAATAILLASQVNQSPEVKQELAAAFVESQKTEQANKPSSSDSSKGKR